jgi:hypothetical protein
VGERLYDRDPISVVGDVAAAAAAAAAREASRG